MNVIKKWNYETKEYDNYKVPSDWITPLWVDDMDTIINCVQCGKKVKYGECYTSKEIHNSFGLGYCVCENCHDLEVKREMENENV